MIMTLLINFVILVVGLMLSFGDTVTKLPTILGIDTDAALSTGVGFFNVYSGVFWNVAALVVATGVILAYFGLKQLIRTFMGARSPI